MTDVCNGQKTPWCGSPSPISLFLLLCSLLFSLQQPRCSGLLVLFRSPEHDQTSGLSVCCLSIWNTFPQITTESLFPPFVGCTTFSVKCLPVCLPIPMPAMPLSLPCFLFLHGIYHIQMLQNIGNLTVVYYHPFHPSEM